MNFNTEVRTPLKTDNMVKQYWLGLLIIWIFASCTQQKHIIYLQGHNQEAAESVYQVNKQNYLLQPDDILFIKILSINKEITEVFNLNNPTTNSAQSFTPAGLYINSYSVNDSGNVELPILGKIYIQGKTLEDAKGLIQAKVDEFLTDATVIVKLVSYKITVLGEVVRPGTYNNYNQRINILEALGMAGDVTSYGNKKNVSIIRPTNEGTRTYKVDLTDRNLLSSENYYLLPNDIVYIEPLRNKAFRMNAPNISILLSSITTLVLVLNFLK